MTLYEPSVVVTDYFLSLECLYFWYWFFASHHLNRSFTKICAGFFFSLAISTFLGGTFHGFFPSETSSTLAMVFWLATLLFIGIVATFIWFLVAELLLGKKTPAFLRPVFLLGLLLYGFTIVFKDHSFKIAIFYYLPPLVVLLVAWGMRFFKYHERDSLIGVLGIILTFVAAVIQQKQISLHPQYFNYNALYHTVQGFGLLLLFKGFKGEALRRFHQIG